jgi:curved DNA-binding protein CbpA
MKQFIDYYAVLNIEYSATNEIIKSAFKKQVNKWHQDINKEDTTEIMRSILEAKTTLLDIKSKKAYDKIYRGIHNIKKEEGSKESKPEERKEEKKDTEQPKAERKKEPVKEPVKEKQKAIEYDNKLNYRCDCKTDNELIDTLNRAFKLPLEYIYVVLRELKKRFSLERYNQILKRANMEKFIELYKGGNMDKGP